MRLIDADALKDKCYITVNGVTIGRNNYVMFHEIDDAPTLDAVNVVRCKDCRYCEEYYDRDGSPYWECAEWDSGTDADGYCHYGQRREK